MEKIIFSVIIFTSACCLSTKHLFHSWDKKSWADARAHCRTYHNDLSRLSSELEEELFIQSVHKNDEGWIGIYWDESIDIPVFKWSGGDRVTYNKVGDQQDFLEPLKHDHNIYWNNGQWQWEDGAHEHSYFCFSLMVVQEEKTWEKAQEHCTKFHHNNLSSLLSETDNLLATNEMNHTNSTERVWIGLRYLGDEWLWVNGDHLVHKNWTQKGEKDLHCPLKRRCGALTKEGVWERWDCQEKLHFICG